MSKYKAGDKLYEYYGVDKDSGKLSWEEITIIQVLDKISEDQYYLATNIGGYCEDYSTYREGAFEHMASSKVGAIKNSLSQPYVFLRKVEHDALLEYLSEEDREELIQYLKEIRIKKLQEEIDSKEKSLMKTKKSIEELKQELKIVKEGKG